MNTTLAPVASPIVEQAAPEATAVVELDLAVLAWVGGGNAPFCGY